MAKTTLLMLVFLWTCVLGQLATAQQFSEKDIDRSREHGIKMLKEVKEQIQKDYYDPKFHGLDLNARFSVAAEKIKQATTGGQVLGIVAQAVLDLNDSHTVLIPPLREAVAVYGWKMQMIGEVCYITAVTPGSDAEAKGLKVGDRVIGLDGNEPTRETMWKMKYYYYGLRPKSHVLVTVQTPEGQQHETDVTTKLEKRQFYVGYDFITDLSDVSAELGSREKHVPLFAEAGPDLIVYRFPSFDVDTDAVGKMMRKISGHKSLVLDLRGNPGGRVDVLERVVGYFFDREVKIGDFKRRKETKEIKVKPRTTDAFLGRLVVLVDSESGSAAEVFARLVQLEKRGTVVGDQSSGSVMESIRYDLEIFQGYRPVLYGLSVTVADILMTDGKSLENVGVTPDKVILKGAADIRNHYDPTLSYAASLAGVTIDAQKAGAMFLPAPKH